MKETAKRTLPRRTPLRRRSRRRGGFSFFVAAFFVLVIALLYFFAGDLLFPAPYTGMVFPAEGEIIVTFLDVGQGDSILLRSADNTVLIDAGEHQARRVVTDYLSDAGIERICYVVATHPHSDHIGGLVTVLRDFEIGRLMKPAISHDTETYRQFRQAIINHEIEYVIPEPGDMLIAGIIEMTVLSPPTGAFSGVNDNSIVLRMVHGYTSFLFTGDAERAAEQWLVANAETLQANVLKVGHHGSRTSTSEAFLSAVTPTAAVIQSGENNRHGHPHREVTERLEAHGVEIFRNDELGTIRMFTDGLRITK